MTEAESALNAAPNLGSEVSRVPTLEGSWALLEKRAAESADKYKAKVLEARPRLNRMSARPHPGGGRGGSRAAWPNPENATAGEMEPPVPHPAWPRRKNAARRSTLQRPVRPAASKKKTGVGHATLARASQGRVRRSLGSRISRMTAAPCSPSRN